MKSITRDMIKIYNIKKIGCDFMGYTFNRYEELSFHHLIIPKKDCKEAGIGDGYLQWNGAILKQETSHDYLHMIERMERELFEDITKVMIDENVKGKIDKENLIKIRKLLLEFESIYSKNVNKQGKQLIKRKFITDRIDL